MKEQEKSLIALKTEKYKDSIFSLVKLLSSRLDSKIVMLHVFSEDKKGDSKLEDAVEGLYDKFEKQNISLSQRIVKFGEFEKVVAQTAENVGAGVIIMPRNVEGGQLNPAITHLLKYSEFPVWSVNDDPSQEIKEIICPVDFSNTSQVALERAVTLAKQLDTGLIVTTISERKETTPGFVQSTEEDFTKEVYEANVKKLDQFLEDVNTDGLNLTKKVAIGNVLNEVNKIISDADKPLLVMGTHGRSGIKKKLIGSVAEEIINNVSCSFLVLKK